MLQFPHDLDLHQEMDLLLIGQEVDGLHRHLLPGLVVRSLVDSASGSRAQLLAELVDLRDFQRVAQPHHLRQGLLVGQHGDLAVGGAAVVLVGRAQLDLLVRVAITAVDSTRRLLLGVESRGLVRG